MRYIVFALVLFSISRALGAEPAPMTIIVHTVRPAEPYAEVLYEVQNGTRRVFRNVEISCVVRSGSGKVIGVGTTILQNVLSGQSAFGSDLVSVPEQMLSDLGDAKCRVVTVE